MIPMDATTDQQGRRITTFELSIAELRAQVAEINGVDTVEVTRYDDEPTKVELRFLRDKDGGD